MITSGWDIQFQVPKLTEDERKELLEPLLANGWTLVNGRDAIHKEFLFKDFNQVSCFSSLYVFCCD